MIRRHRCAVLLLVLALSGLAQVRPPRPGFNLFSKEQDVKLGREAAAEIEKQLTVVNNAEVSGYIQRVGSRLVRSRYASDFPYSFKVVADDSVNAFALPGGPMYIHTGLIMAADTEAQLAGVMAHEISHVALRHGTNQASKANLLQLPALLATQAGGGGLLGGLAKAGIGLGANSVLLKFSRTAETQADTNGVLILSEAGFNPIEMARFFEKLEAESGRRSGVAAWFSSHPNPGDRSRNVQGLLRQLPSRQYSADSAELKRIQTTVARIPGRKPQAR